MKSGKIKQNKTANLNQDSQNPPAASTTWRTHTFTRRELLRSQRFSSGAKGCLSAKEPYGSQALQTFWGELLSYAVVGNEGILGIFGL